MTESCPKCGSMLPADLLSGHCPQCLVQVSLELAAATLGPPHSVAFPRVFGDYELIEEVARGGMGVVYRARQISLNRIVAVKMILSGQFASREAVERFRVEARATASLQHPGIVAIHEVGECEGQAYFTMDFIEGRSLAALVWTGPLPSKRAARYLAEIATAIHHAHKQGILHRDLKPSNVIIDAFDQPRVMDFGLAKRLEEASSLTVTGQALGSPGYMAPEQASLSPEGAGVRSDVYSLGALLYHLITGRAPFAAGTVAETLRQVTDNEPLSPRALNPAVPIDVETVCLKCLEKEPARRYSSAQAVADELNRFLCGEPIIARPVGWIEQAWRWCRRNPVVTVLAVGIAALLIALVAASTFAVWRIELARRAESRESRRAVEANTELARANGRLAESVTTLELQRAEEFFRSGDASAGLAQLAGVLRHDGSNQVAAERLIAALLYRDFVLPAGPPLAHPGKVSSVEFSQDGLWLLTVCGDGAARVWETATRQEMASLRTGKPVFFARFSPDGARVATVSADDSARIWNWKTGQTITPALSHGSLIHAVEFSLDGNRVVTGGADRTARIWSANSGELLSTISNQVGGVIRVGFSRDGTQILTALSDFTVRGWTVETGAPTGLLLRHGLWVEAISISPDGERFATASRDRTVGLWDASTGASLTAPLVHPDGLNNVAFSSDGRLLVTSCMDNAARVWDAYTGELRSQALRHPEQVTSATFSPDGRRLVTGCRDGFVYFWDLQPAQALSEPMPHLGRVKWIEFSPEGRYFASASEDNTAQVWDVRTRRPVTPPLRHDSHVQCARFSPDGRRIITASADSTARIWDARTGQSLAGPFRHSLGLWTASFSPDGKRVVTASADHTVQVWDAESATRLTAPIRHQDEAFSAWFSPDGKRIVTASADHTARVWDADTGQPLGKPMIHGDQVVWAEFSADGRHVATASLDNTARVWNAASGEALGDPLRHARTVQTIRFSPDGRQVVTASSDHTARIWDAATGEPLTPPLPHDDQVWQACYSPDGSRVVTASAAGGARIWDAATGLPLTEPLNQLATATLVCFSPDSQWIAAGCSGAESGVRLWYVPGAPRPIPSWLPDLGEAVAGLSIGPYATTRGLPQHTLTELKARLTATEETNSFALIARWFFADRSTRTISPFTSLTVDEYVRQRIKENTRGSLEEATRLQPTNALALARLAKSVLSVDNLQDPRSLAEAGHLARHALRFDPDQPEARDVLARIEHLKSSPKGLIDGR